MLKSIINNLPFINNSDSFLACSNCFNDEGLRLDSSKLGVLSNEKCKNCKSISGFKLNKKNIKDLCYRFFVRGTIRKEKYGGYPFIQANEFQNGFSSIEMSPWLIKDVKLIEKIGEIGLFYYGPRFWMLGQIEPLERLQMLNDRDAIIDMILDRYPIRELLDGEFFYRLRINPSNPSDFNEFDSPPVNLSGKGRFDSNELQILYGSQDLDICIHECRVSVEDEIFVSKLSVKNKLKLIDLTELLEEDVTEFESLDLAIHFLFLAGSHSYEICRDLAKRAFEKGFDGFIYPSYFSHVRTGNIPFETELGVSIRKYPNLKNYASSQVIPNLAIFGRPIEKGIIKVDCINKVVINKVIYETSFGPIIL